MQRTTAFIITIILGLAAGIALGWLIFPLNTHQVSAGTLRADYQADLVLMAAEAYQGDLDLTQAANRLSLLGEQPLELVQQAYLDATKAGFEPADLAAIQALGGALQAQPRGSP